MLKVIKRVTAAVTSAVLLMAVTGCTQMPENSTPDNATSDTAPATSANTPGGQVSTGEITQEETDLGLKPYVPTKKFTVKPGLYLENGKLMHDGKEYRSIGVNFNSAFAKAFLDPLNSEYEDIFGLMNEYGIEYARVSWGMFWPINYKVKESNKKFYFDTMDAVVKSAEKHNIGLICSMFWNPTGLSDFCDEPANAWGNPDSKTRKYMADYVKLVVSRYKNSPAIWGWEFCNELNLACDLPNRAEARKGGIVPQMGTRLTRDENDDYITDFVTPLLADFAKLIRQYDPYGRIITGGNAEPRPSQYNQRMNNTWTADDREQMAETLEWHNPAPMDCVQIHTYDLLKRFEGTDTYVDWLKAINEETIKQGKVLFVGEFHSQKGKSEEIIDAIVANNVPLAAVWAIGDVEYSLDNDKARRAEVLKYIQEANKKYGEGM